MDARALKKRDGKKSNVVEIYKREDVVENHEEARHINGDIGIVFQQILKFIFNFQPNMYEILLLLCAVSLQDVSDHGSPQLPFTCGS